MIDNDNLVKKAIQKNIQNHSLSQSQKTTLLKLMQKELDKIRLPWYKRLIYDFRVFWNTTYEISLTPIITCIACILLFITIKLPLFYTFDTNRDQDIIFTQNVFAKDNQTTISYTPVERKRI